MSDDIESDPLGEFAHHDRMKALLQEYLHRLSESGLEIHVSEQEPDMDDYVARFLADLPAHLVGIRAEELEVVAIQAWADAAMMRQERQAFADHCQTEAANLATRRLMLDEVQRRIPLDEGLELQREMRQEIFTDFWLEGWWKEPWIGLIETEFPGDPITQADIDGAEATRAQREEERQAREAAMHSLNDEMESFLADHGLIPEPADLHVLILAIHLITVRNLDGETSTADALNYRLTVSDVINSLSTGSSKHSAWTDFRDHYFPIPE